MREYRFRAWDKGEKGMLYRGIFDRNWYATPYNDEDGCHCVRGIVPENRHYMKLMQYTGLKDKNGKEIYGGDIQIVDGGIYEIVWDCERAGFARRIIKPMRTSCEIKGELCDMACCGRNDG